MSRKGHEMTKVFIHGNPETSAIWSPVFASLHKRGVDDVVALTPPGFGAPIPTGWTATASEYTSWLIHELEEIGGVLDIVGHDWGAGHVFSLLATRPDLVRTWTTDCIGLLHPDYAWHDAAQGWQTPEVGEQIVEAMISMPDEDFVTSFSQLGMTPAIAASVKQSINNDMGQCILGLYRDAQQPAMARLGEKLIVHPPKNGMVVIADQDHFAGTVSMMHEMAEALRADVVRLDGCGHWWMIEEPDQAAEALIHHWSSQ